VFLEKICKKISWNLPHPSYENIYVFSLVWNGNVLPRSSLVRLWVPSFVLLCYHLYQLSNIKDFNQRSTDRLLPIFIVLGLCPGQEVRADFGRKTPEILRIFPVDSSQLPVNFEVFLQKPATFSPLSGGIDSFREAGIVDLGYLNGFIK